MAKNNSKIPLSVVGKSLPIKDAREKVTGSLKYAIDHKVPDMAYGKILRSPHAHARIKGIDCTRAEALPGVFGVVTYKDAPDLIWEAHWHNYRGHILDDRARFVGDEVAAVAAVDEDIAKQAVKLIEVDYEILPDVFDPEDALKPDAPQVIAEGNAREPFIVSWGDVDEGIKASDIVAEGSMNFESQHYAPIGRNACIAEWSGDRVTMWSSSQTPSECRDGIAMGLGVPLSKVRVISMPSGCSQGMWWSNNFQLVTVLLAKKVRRPVKIELDQRECFATVKRRHLERSRGRIGCSKDGSLVSIEVDHIFDNGGYGFKDDPGYLCADMWGKSLNGRFAVQGVSTNLVTAGCMRGVGDVTLGAFLERLLDMAAIKLEMDPLEFRLKNHIRAGDPLQQLYNTELAEDYQIPPECKDKWPQLFHLSCEALHECLTKGAELFGWKEKWKGWGKPLAVEGQKRRAVGVGTGTHCCGTEEDGGTSAIVRVHSDGSVSLSCSMGRHGQGSETTQAQIVAEALGISPDQIDVEAGDTEVCPWSHGSVASNTAYRAGFTTKSASMDARYQILEIAARHYIKGEPEQLDIKDGIIFHKEHPEQNMPLAEFMSTHQPDTLAPPVIIGRPTERMPPTITLARQFAAHFAEVEVDTETGQIKLLNYLATQDSGTMLNPKVLENQVSGGAIIGSGFALVEGMVFDEKTGEVLNPNFLDYKVLRAPDFPTQFETLFCESYDPVGPYGAKGAGESPIAASIPAIAQAVYNAIGTWLDVPMTPERVLRGLGKI
ncbi:MAG: molybdopterin-dependent oxidoreductase [Desulfotignum sp.]|nr:molybdopterin-dependent oxidoreductase [Desulfobacterales bacterium]MCF8090638.1 molybdopterin-dependent oxidoreductase [Desulfotignum sp.]